MVVGRQHRLAPPEPWPNTAQRFPNCLPRLKVVRLTIFERIGPTFGGLVRLLFQKGLKVGAYLFKRKDKRGRSLIDAK